MTRRAKLSDEALAKVHRRIGKDETGNVFGRLTVVERVENPLRNGIAWRCSCSCGGGRIVLGHALRAGIIRSCGCLRSEASKRAAERAREAMEVKRAKRDQGAT